MRRRPPARATMSRIAAQFMRACVGALVLSGCPSTPDPQPDPEPVLEMGRIAIVNTGSAKGKVHAYEAPIATFQESVGRPVHIHDLKGQAKTAAGRAQVKRAIAAKPPLIFAIGSDALKLCRQEAKGIPIVFAMVIDWKDHDLDKDGGVTGVALEVPPEVQLTQLKIVAPSVKRIGVIASPHERGFTNEAKKAGKRLGLTVKVAEAGRPDAVPAAWGKLKGSIDALWMIPDPRIFDKKGKTFLYLKAACEKAKVPFMGYSDRFVEAGCLLSLSADYEAIGAQAGILAARILDGETTASSDTVQQPIGTVLSINVGTAAIIGLDVEDDILDLADRVVGEDFDEEFDEDE